jgi:hypothetical protein
MNGDCQGVIYESERKYKLLKGEGEVDCAKISDPFSEKLTRVNTVFVAIKQFALVPIESRWPYD